MGIFSGEPTFSTGVLESMSVKATAEGGNRFVGGNAIKSFCASWGVEE